MAKYFTYYEFIKSDTANRLKIDNTPTSPTVQNNILEMMKVMDKIRENWTQYCKENYLGSAAIIVNSGYRSEALNKAVNGSKTLHIRLAQLVILRLLMGKIKLFLRLRRRHCWITTFHSTSYSMSSIGVGFILA